VRSKYCIEGPARFDGLWEKICEHTCAGSEAQAFWFLARKLERERNQAVYLGNCSICIIERLPPDKPRRILMHKEIREKQLELFKIHKAP
jgi:hypothetical protein